MVHVARRTFVIVLFLVAAFLAVQTSLPEKVHAQSNVYVASLIQDIDPGAENFIVSSINDATSSGIHSFILILNTNGGSGVNMENIIFAISEYEAAGNNFTTLIAPNSAHSFSAGAYIAESSTKILMVPGTLIGSATPIVSGIPTGEENTTLTKDINAFATYMVALTDQHGRNPNATKLMVTGGVSYACGTVATCDAYQQHVVDLALNENSTRQALTWMSQNGWQGAALIALALLGLGVFGAPLVSIVLMMIGAIFIFLELKIHHGVAAIAGVIIFIVGFLLIFTLPSSAPIPAGAPSGTFVGANLLTYTVLGIVGGGGVLGSIYLYRVREVLMRRPPAQNPKAIIGKQGYLTSDLSPGEVATANIGSEDYSVTGSVGLPRGSQVRVKDVQGLRLIVEKVEG